MFAKADKEADARASKAAAEEMWKRRAEFKDDVEAKKRQKADARAARDKENKQKKAQRAKAKAQSRAKFAQRLGVSAEGTVRYLDWSCSKLRAEVDRRGLKRPKQVDASTLAHLLLKDDERNPPPTPAAGCARRP